MKVEAWDKFQHLITMLRMLSSNEVNAVTTPTQNCRIFIWLEKDITYGHTAQNVQDKKKKKAILETNKAHKRRSR